MGMNEDKNNEKQGQEAAMKKKLLSS